MSEDPWKRGIPELPFAFEIADPRPCARLGLNKLMLVGYRYLAPGHVFASVRELRLWTFENHLLALEDQLISDAAVRDVRAQIPAGQDRRLVVSLIPVGGTDLVMYWEQLYVSVRSLISLGQKVHILQWVLRSTPGQG